MQLLQLKRPAYYSTAPANAIPAGHSSKTKAFIEKARAKHGDLYDYSKTVYVRSRDKVTIICSEHGEFEQSAADHFSGRGCRECSGTEPITTESFISKARAAHGDRYDYSKTSCVRSRDKVTIICREHGEFEQKAAGHLRGNGCRNCSGTEPITTESFISKARAVHGERYDYSKTVYVRNRDKVTIICREHGEFEQKAAGHLRGGGCRECAIVSTASKKTNSAEYFTSQARAVHGERYDYSKTVYVRNRNKVTIICREHGEFEQNAACHLSGSGCRECGNSSIAAKLTSSSEYFISQARAIHGDRYGYSKVEYLSAIDKVTIICREHGEFEQSATGHLRGSGCRECSGTEPITTESFISKARAVHGDRYDYSKTSCGGSRDKVTIICREHGEFEQNAAGHLRGAGCNRCPYRYGEPTSVYLMTNGKQVKIGYSIDPDMRLVNLNRAQPFAADLMLYWVLPDAPTARAAEADIHKQLAEYHAGLSGFDGATEWFNTTPLHAQAVIANAIKQVTARNGGKGGYGYEE